MLRTLNEVVKHKMSELDLFEQEEFIFPEDIKFQGLDKFIKMEGNCYHELVEIAGLKEVGVLSHKFDCPLYKKIRKTEMIKSFMRYRGRYRKEKGFLFKWLDKEEKVIAFIIGHILLPGRYSIIKLTPKDVCLLYSIVQRIQKNWVVVFKEHILEVGTGGWHKLPYGVFISKVLETCGRKI
ncbi:hypothetical protein V8G54_005527 [Vigna mungo]|uniref:Uncharacterized protein n=1 Tax=Vigna mungo TaxID=3915 RepID=A0AAQ3NZE4_VIGMU